LEKLPCFSFAKNALVSFLSKTECSSFSSTAFGFCFHLDLHSHLLIFIYQGVFFPLIFIGFHQKRCLQKVQMVLEKRKSFVQKVVQEGACVDCGLGFFMSCLMSLDSMLSGFAVA
jgi:hypothetical protein